ncbi:hypothetical protein [Kocuria aegyptia]
MAELSWLPEPLHPVAYRIGRADELGYQLGLESFQWSRSKPLARTRRRENGTEQLVVTGIRPVPPRISMMFSEAVNHLRAAIDNVVFHLAGQTEEGPLNVKREKAVAFPIYGDEGKYEEWCKTTRRRVPQLTPGAQLGDRIRSLQPFASAGRAIASVEPRVAYLNGMEVHREHPLLLLQEYSNTDKHRALRVAVHRSLETVRGDNPAGDARPMRTIEVGDVLPSTRIGTPVFAEHSPFVAIERPGIEDVVVNPGHRGAPHREPAATAGPGRHGRTQPSAPQGSRLRLRAPTHPAGDRSWAP